MFDRAQSDAIGVILLTGILTVTITGAGGVVLTEWQSDISPTPLADIDSEITPVEMTLEHLGGDPLAPNETTVVLVGSDANVSLEERFEPGETESWAFDRLDGPVELRIVDDESGEIVYSRSHAVENPVEDLILAVDGWTEPVYLLEDHPANYSVEQEFEQGVPADVTGRANITVDDGSQLTVDEDETTIEGTDAGFETTAIVEVDNRTAETDVQVLDNPQQLQVRTLNVSAVDLTSLTVTGELAELDDLPSANLSVDFAPLRPFNGEPGDNGDNIISDGPFVGTNYTHSNDGWIHDNEPIEPGTTRTYIYKYTSEVDTDDSYWALRDSEQITRYEKIFDLDIVVDKRIPFERPGTYRIELTLSEDGQTADVVVYNDPTGGSEVSSKSDIDVSSISDLYFSTHYDRYYNENDLRLTDIYDDSKTTRVVHNSAVDTEDTFSEDTSDLILDREYLITTRAEQVIGGAHIVNVSSGTRREIAGPTVDTVAAEATGIDSVNITGELVNLGTATQANLSVGYTPLRPFNGEPGDNGDNIISTGPFVGTNYTHSNQGWIHDNKPIEPGTTRTYTYEYISRGENDEIEWALRDGEQTTRSGRKNVIEDTNEISFDQPGAYRIELTLSEDGQTADVAVYDELAGGSKISSTSGIDVSSYSELYFSTLFDLYDNENNLHLTGIYDSSDTNRVVHDSAVESEGTFSEEITGLNANRSYAVIVYAERQKNGQMVSNIGSLIWVDTEDP